MGSGEGRCVFRRQVWIVAGEDFLAGDADTWWSIYGQPYTSTANLSDGDADIAGDLNGFANFTAEHQHLSTWGEVGGRRGVGDLRFGEFFEEFEDRQKLPMLKRLRRNLPGIREEILKIAENSPNFW